MQLLARLYPHVPRREPEVVRQRIARFRTAAERNTTNGDVQEALGELSAPTDPAGELLGTYSLPLPSRYCAACLDSYCALSACPSPRALEEYVRAVQAP